MRIWTIANQKGGVGKTTTTIALGGLLADQGQRVLLVDLDPHGSMTSYFGYDAECLPGNAQALFAEQALRQREDLKRLLVPIGDSGIELLAAHVSLATVERRASAIEGMGLRLSRALALLWDDFDYVLIDTPPVLGALMINALAACEQLIIPVQTEFLALKGLERMLRTLEMVSRSRGRTLPHLIVPTLFDRRTQASVSSLRLLRNTYREPMWPAMIPVDTRLRDASKAGVVPSHFDPGGRAVQAYQSLLKHIQQGQGRNTGSGIAEAAWR